MNSADGCPVARVVALTSIVVIVVLLWTTFPFGDSNGRLYTFASSVIENTTRFSRDIWSDWLREQMSSNRVISGIIAIFSPLPTLYPAVLASLLLLAPSWPATWPRWVWIAQGIAVIALMPLVLLWAYFEVFNFAGPILNPGLWLLLGLNVASGACAIGVGIAPHGALGRFLLPATSS